ncbi:PAS domain-containing sensor histidine kinase [Geomonas sp.]|uniref:sensor histidine kinase n=1 Tax=Geomonas sp. TaxID=2651584 RepID=UPI002B46482D|nr:PAS domain-containing sensor histidine kinase [Geomonas sp.]HJV33476.1 PAS domain-containing sensor histidine kinase [Geomonas sp.]
MTVEDSEKRYRALLLASSDVVYRMSPDWGEMRELLGRDFLSDTVAPITDWLQKYIHPDDQSHVMEVIKEAISTRSTFQLEHRILRADHTIGWTFSRAVPLFDHAGEIVEWVGAAIDITGRKEAEEALKKSERKFSTFFHAASVLMTITTFEEGRVIDINEVALQSLGYTREEIIGKTVHQTHIWDDPADRELVLQMLEGQGSIRNLEIRIRGKSGKLVIGLLSAESIVVDDERWILAVTRDITERKEAEEKIKQLNAELQVANKELEAFSYMVAHDLRNPLNVMSNSFQAVELLCGERLPQECREVLQLGYQSTVRMNQMIGALLDFSRMAHVEPRREKIDVSAMAAEVAAELRLTAPERKVQFEITEGLTADADGNLLRVVLDNLIGNAWKYTVTQAAPVIQFGTLTMDGKQVFFVRDNGPGFEHSEEEQIFTPFHRLAGTQKVKGFGIGLATVERIVQRHGGRIWAKGEPNHGATFYFTLSEE